MHAIFIAEDRVPDTGHGFFLLSSLFPGNVDASETSPFTVKSQGPMYHRCRDFDPRSAQVASPRCATPVTASSLKFRSSSTPWLVKQACVTGT